MRCYDPSIHGSYTDYTIYRHASYLCATTNLGPREADQVALERYCSAVARRPTKNGEFRDIALYLHLREKGRRGHERNFHQNGYQVEDLRLMERDQAAMCKFVAAWVEQFGWLAYEDDELNSAIAAMWIKHDALQHTPKEPAA